MTKQVRITLASPEQIRSRSRGPVRIAATLDADTLAPIEGGLFCEKIFGRLKTKSRARRLGHIELAAPIVHIWFFKSNRCPLKLILDMSRSDLERVIYFQNYIIISPGQTPLKPRQLLDTDEYNQARRDYGRTFEAAIGADAIRTLLTRFDPPAEIAALKRKIAATESPRLRTELARRLRFLESLLRSGNRPEWMVMQALPVIPPRLRPIRKNSEKPTSPLNQLYAAVINRNSRLLKLAELNAPDVIMRNEMRMLQQAVDHLFHNRLTRHPALDQRKRPLNSLADKVRMRIAGARSRSMDCDPLDRNVDFSASGLPVPDPTLRLDQVGLPWKIAAVLFELHIHRRMIQCDFAQSPAEAREKWPEMLRTRDPLAADLVEEAMAGRAVILSNQSPLQRSDMQAFEAHLVSDDAIHIHPLVWNSLVKRSETGRVSVHLPLTIPAQAEAQTLMLAPASLLSTENGSSALLPTDDIILGLFHLTSKRDGDKGEYMTFASSNEAILAHEAGKISMHARILVRIERAQVVSAENGPPKSTADESWRTTHAHRGHAQVTQSDKPDGFNSRVIRTTAGRCLFNQRLPFTMPFYNFPMSRAGLKRVIADCLVLYQRGPTINLLDAMKDLGFKWSTRAGISLGITDLRVPESKPRILEESAKSAEKHEKNCRIGAITSNERLSHLMDVWSSARRRIGDDLVEQLAHDDRDPDGRPVPPKSPGAVRHLNPLYLALMGQCGLEIAELRRLAGMIGQSTLPSGELIAAPITANLREGISPLEFFSTTFIARKNLIAGVLKSADPQYLTRKLLRLARDVIIRQSDCRTRDGISKSIVHRGQRGLAELRHLIAGRTSRDTIIDPVTRAVIVAENEMNTPQIAARIQSMGIDIVRVRSPLACESPRGICAKCYGADLSTGDLAEPGLAAGVIAAQSAGEHPAHFKMQVRHVGGALGDVGACTARSQGIVRLRDVKPATIAGDDGSPRTIALGRNARLVIINNKGGQLEEHPIPYGATLLVAEGQSIRHAQKLAEWEPYRNPILAEAHGVVSFEDIEEGFTARFDEIQQRQKKLHIIAHDGRLHPRIEIIADDGRVLAACFLPIGAWIDVEEGVSVEPGRLLAQMPHQPLPWPAIVHGIHRVIEILEGRTHHGNAALAEISGIAGIRDEPARGRTTIIIRNENGEEREHRVSRDRGLRIYDGYAVEAGDELTHGTLSPQDVLRILGEEALYQHQLAELRDLYRQQEIIVDDRHFEILLRQLVRSVKIEESGDSDFMPGESVERHRWTRALDNLAKAVRITDPGGTGLKIDEPIDRQKVQIINQAAESSRKAPARFRRARPPMARLELIGMTRASQRDTSFIAAAGERSAATVLTQAALAGAIDPLDGPQERIITGQIAPVGTGFNK